MELAQAFGLDVKLLIAHTVNFVLLAAILYKIGYRPILKFMHEREEKIKKGVENALDAEQKLSNATERHKHILAKAHAEAQEIISRAREHAEAQARDIIEKTKLEAKEIVARAKKEIADQQHASQQAVRRDAVSVVMALTEKLLRKKVNAKEDEAFIKKSLDDIV